MVWKIKRLLMCLVVAVVLITATCGTVQAATHTVYENGSLGTTYITYFKDILSGAKLTDNYIAFRSGQYSYSMIVGELEYTNGVVSLVGEGKEYIYSTNSSGYNSQYVYNVNSISNFSVSVGDAIIYSDVGDFPELIERGAKFEILNTLLICITLLSFVIRRIFFKR